MGPLAPVEEEEVRLFECDPVDEVFEPDEAVEDEWLLGPDDAVLEEEDDVDDDRGPVEEIDDDDEETPVEDDTVEDGGPVEREFEQEDAEWPVEEDVEDKDECVVDWAPVDDEQLEDGWGTLELERELPEGLECPVDDDELGEEEGLRVVVVVVVVLVKGDHDVDVGAERAPGTTNVRV